MLKAIGISCQKLLKRTNAIAFKTLTQIPSETGFGKGQ